MVQWALDQPTHYKCKLRDYWPLIQINYTGKINNKYTW